MYMATVPTAATTPLVGPGAAAHAELLKQQWRQRQPTCEHTTQTLVSEPA